MYIHNLVKIHNPVHVVKFSRFENNFKIEEDDMLTFFCYISIRNQSDNFKINKKFFNNVIKIFKSIFSTSFSLLDHETITGKM